MEYSRLAAPPVQSNFCIGAIEWLQPQNIFWDDCASALIHSRMFAVNKLRALHPIKK